LKVERVQSDRLLEDANKHVLTDRPVAWQTDNPEVISIRPGLPSIGTGLIALGTEDSRGAAAADALFFHRSVTVYGHQAGRAFLTATSEGINRRITVLVKPSDPASLEIFPDSLLLDVGQTAHVRAVARNQQGCLMSDVPIAYQIADSTVATVDGTTGDVHGLKAGKTALSATTPNGVTDSIEITIPAVSDIVLDIPAGVNDLDIGERLEIRAKPISESGNALSNREVAWTRSNSNVDVQPSSGYTTNVTGRVPGDTTITVASESVSRQFTVTVAKVSSVQISPDSASLSVGSARDLKATPCSPYGKSLDREVTWTRSNSNVDVQPSSGYTTKVTGRAPGDTTVSAWSDNTEGRARIHVRDYCEDNTCAASY
jgi:hypothetical protein